MSAISLMQDEGGGLIAFVVVFTLALFAFSMMIVVTSAIRIVPEYQRLVVLRLGHLLRTVGPGVVLLIPFLDSAVRVDLREQEGRVSQTTLTRDDTRVSIDCGWRYKVLDPLVSALQAPGKLDAALRQLVEETLGTLAGTMTYDQLRTERRQMDETLRVRLDETAQSWGIRITHTEIRDIARA